MSGCSQSTDASFVAKFTIGIMELAFMTLGKEKVLLKTESWYTHACLQD